ncbi:proliferating cell nuclear antigen [Cubamyces sp. BRFM 1775]|nr:proliferating cell nuclear antigen [Cubamyces sp. BRFM 1775]
MLEAKLSEAGLLKRLLDAVKELISDANFDCNEEGMTLQAMDNSHVALVAVKLEAAGFKRYRCDRPIPLGVNVASLTKVVKCAKDDDITTLKAADDADVLTLTYEGKNSDRIAEYEMKLMDIDADTLGIPDTEYDASVTMPSAEFARIVRDLSNLGESVRIEVSKEGIRFVTDGESANGNILIKQSAEAPSKKKGSSSKRNDDDDDEPEDEEGASGDEVDDGEGGKKKIKKEKVKKEENGDEDVEMNGEDEDEDAGEFKPSKKDKGSDDEDEDEDEDGGSSKKRKKAPGKSSKPAKKAKKEAESDDDDDDFDGVRIEMNQAVTLTFSLKYLVNFSKSSALSKKVQLMMSNDVPLLVSYGFNQGHIRYYLAPKIGDD